MTAQPEHRPRAGTVLEQGWHFRFEDGPCETVTLPHSWNALDSMNTDPAAHYRRGVGVYQLDFVPPPGSESQRLWLEFGAVAQRGQVFFDGDLLAEHHGGYTAFTVEIPNRPGLLRVIADNRPDPDLIPSDLSDFFLYGGITRPVYLYSTGHTRLDRPCFDIETTIERASVRLRGHLDGESRQNLTLEVALTAPGASMPLYTEQYTLTGNPFTLALPDVIDPLLWSPERPQLYTANLTLRDGNRTLDQYRTQIGFRWFDFPEGGPFLLNGERLLLRGTHRHDDWAGHSAAVPDALVRQEMAQIKAARFNFIRLGHYPQDDLVLHLCDRLGLIVWEELPWCRGGVGGQTFRQHARTMLTEMMTQHYNHPSVVFWGLGNELDWESEHPNSDDAQVAAFLRELHEQAHTLDPRRLTALRRFEPGAAIVDVYSPSIWSGWYRGRYQDYEAVLMQAMARYPRLLHIEWGGDSHVGRHNNGPHIEAEVAVGYDHSEVPGTATSEGGFARYSKDGDWSESYIIDLMAHHLAVQARLSQLAGTAQWVYKDFGTPLRPENPLPYVNQKGLVGRDGTPKDVYFVFQAFQTDTPLVHLESSAWPLRVSEGHAPQTIRVITNCDQVKLLVNGSAQGRKNRRQPDAPAEVIHWSLPLPPGNHTLTAVAYRAGKPCARHTVTQRVALGNCGPVTQALLTVERESERIALCVQLADADGRPVTTDERRVRFTLVEGGALLRWQGTMGGSDLLQTANGRAWVNLLPGHAESVCARVEIEGLERIEEWLHVGRCLKSTS